MDHHRVESDDEVARQKMKAQQEMDFLQKQLEKQQLESPEIPPDSPAYFLPRASSSNSSSSSSTASSKRGHKHKIFASMLRSLVRGVNLPCFRLSSPFPPPPSSSSSKSALSSSSGRRRSSRFGRKKMTGTLFGYRKGHVHFSVQEDPTSPPVLLLELTTPTSTLVREMASGLVRIALECEKTNHNSVGNSKAAPLLSETDWTMYCNGRRSGFALRKSVGDMEIQILGLLQAVSMGAGVLPMEEQDGELMYMRARFERVVGSKDSEAFYMLNPDRTDGPELSIFLLRI